MNCDRIYRMFERAVPLRSVKHIWYAQRLRPNDTVDVLFIRCDAPDVRLTKSQKKVAKRMRNFLRNGSAKLNQSEATAGDDTMGKKSIATLHCVVLVLCCCKHYVNWLVFV